jgi:anti-sigma B factor antagonist
LAGARPPYILINLAELAFTDSTGLGVIISGYQRSKARGGMLALAAVPPNTSALLRVAGLTRLLPLHATIDDALSALVAGGATCQ